METDEAGASGVAMETDSSTANDGPLPFVISAVRSEKPESVENENEGTNSADKPCSFGMMLPIAPPVGNGTEPLDREDSTGVLPSVPAPPKPSRKVARKSTAKAAKNLIQKQEVTEANNNDLSKDTDLEVKRKEAARRLQEKLKLFSKFSKKPADVTRNSTEETHDRVTKDPVKTSHEVGTKVKLKLPKTKDELPKVLISNDSTDEHQVDMQVSPPSEQPKKILCSSVTEFKAIPQHSSTPNIDGEKHVMKRKREVEDSTLDSSNCNDIETHETPKKKVLRSSSMCKSPDLSLNKLMFLRAFIYDGLDECPTCSTQFINMNSLKKHLKNGHRVLLVREADAHECGKLDILNRDELHDFLNSVRPSACRFCGMKYKYLSCVFKHEKNCVSRPAENVKSENMLQDVSDPAESCFKEKVGNGIKKYHCLVCSDAFGDKDSFLSHFAEFHGKNNNKSDAQTADFDSSQELDDTLVHQLDQTPYDGQQISGSFTTSTSAGFNSEPDGVPPINQGFTKEYQSDGMFAWRCLVCDMKLSHKSNLKRHYGRHTEYFYKCGNCTLRIKTVKEYRTHKFMCYTKLAKKPVPAMRYPISFSRKPATIGRNPASSRVLSALSRVVSTKVQKSGFRVGGLFMKRVEKTSIGPKEGIKKVNIGGTTQWKCTICQKKLKYLSTMEKHYVCHFNGKNEHFCKFCNHKSMDEPSHKSHEADCWTVAPPDGIVIKTPTEARQANGSLKCCLCDRVFWHVYNYKRHAMKHSGLGAFKCDKCGARYKSFRDRDNCCRDNTETMDESDAVTDPINAGDTKQEISVEDSDPYKFNEGMDGNGVEDMSNKSLTAVRRKSADIAAARARQPRKISTEIQPVQQAEKTGARKRKSAMDGLTHGDVMQWARKLLTVQTNKSKNKSKTSKCYLNLKSHKCPICKRSFTSKSYLKTHLMYHARGPPEDCPYCGKSFIYHSYRSRHIETCKGAADAVADGADSDATEIEDAGEAKSETVDDVAAGATIDENGSINEADLKVGDIGEGSGDVDDGQNGSIEDTDDVEKEDSAEKEEVEDGLGKQDIATCGTVDVDAKYTAEKPVSTKVRKSKMENDNNNNRGVELIQEKTEKSDVKSEQPIDDPGSHELRGKGYTKINIDDKLMYECNMCKRLFREHEVAVMHVKIHQKNSFRCNLCAKSFPTWMQFQRHQIMSHGVRPIEEIESDAESDIVISDSDSESDEEVYIDMEDDMKPKEVVEIEDVKPVLLKNIKRTSIMRSFSGQSSGQVSGRGSREKPGGVQTKETKCDDYHYYESDSETPADDIQDSTTYNRSFGSKYEGAPIEKTQNKPKTKKKQFECDFCHKMLACSSALYRHRLGHFGPATYRCDSCSIGFVTPKDRNQHNFDFHGIPKPVYGGTLTKSHAAASNVDAEKMEVDAEQGQFDDADYDAANNAEHDGSTQVTKFSTNVAGQGEDNYDHSLMHSNFQASKERDAHSPALTDSSDGSQSSKRSKGYLCPGCHKLIKSETVLYSHMNLCIPDQPGLVYKCTKCSDHFMFRAAHIIHELQCSAKRDKNQDELEDLPPDEPIITPTSLRKRSIVSTTPEGSVASGTPPIGSMTEAPTFGLHESHQEIPQVSEEGRLSNANESSVMRTPGKEGKDSASIALLNKAARGVQSLYCLECNKELKAWSLHKHVNQCCPSKAAMFHTCDMCGHSVKTYAGYMIHAQLGCESNKQATVRSSGGRLSLSPGNGEMTGYQDNFTGLQAGQELGQAVFTAFQDSQTARPIGSMEIVSPNGQPIKVEIDYNFNDESFPSYTGSQGDSLTPGGMEMNDTLAPDGSTAEHGRRYICEHCNKEYRSHSGLDHHKKKCTGHQMTPTKDDGRTGMSLKVNLPTKKQPQSGFRCQFCGDTFFHAALLHVHEASHSAKLHRSTSTSIGTLIPQQGVEDVPQTAAIASQSVKIMSCNICGKEFINKQRLQRHEKIHLNVKPFKCKLCSKGFGRRDNLRQHEFLVHKIKRNASDDDIDPQFPEIGQSMKHPMKGGLKARSAGRTSMEVQEEQLESLVEEYDQEESGMDLSIHDEDTTEHEDSYEAMDEMNDYEQMAEGTNEDFEAFTVKQQYQCQLCPITCESLSAIKKHMATHSDDRPHKCDVCGLSFKQMGNLNRHKLTHEGVENAKSYVCPYCDKCYSQKLSLHAHILTHTGERPFKCRFCPKTFGREQVLKNHEKIHMEKAYECDICFKKFARNDAMKVHRLHHLNDNQKPHRCDLCERGFVTRQQLTDHRRSHTNERPYPCRHCRKSFTTAGGRGLHERLHNAKVVNYCCPTCKIIMHNYGSYKKHVAVCQVNGPDATNTDGETSL